jgi:hypothetical protein
MEKYRANTDYEIVTINDGGKSFEKLDYQLTVIKDQFPVISARVVSSLSLILVYHLV